jgi:hypothetical protein
MEITSSLKCMKQLETDVCDLLEQNVAVHTFVDNCSIGLPKRCHQESYYFWLI